MTLKNSSFKAGLLRETVRRNVWAAMLAVLGFFFALPLPVAMVVQELNNRGLSAPLRKHLLLREQIQKLIGLDSPLPKLVMIVMAVVCAVAVFSYLHSRQKTDFYHSLPISRKKLFVVHYMAGAVIVLPCYLIMLLITYLIALASGCGDAILIAQPLETIAAHVIFFAAIYSLTAACVILCGNTVVSLLLTGWAVFSLPVARILWETLKMTFFQTYMDNAFSLTAMSRLSPVVQYLALYPRWFQGDVNYFTLQCNIWIFLAVYVLVAAALTALAFFLYIHRKSERAGAAIAFTGLKAPLKFWCCTVMAVGVGWIFYGIVGSSRLWMYFGFLTGGVLTHFLMEIIYSFDFKAIFHNWKPLLIYTGVFAVFIGCMKFDVVGYDRYLPKEESVQAVNVAYYGAQGSGQNGMWQVAGAQPDLTDPANIDAALTMAGKAVDNLNAEDMGDRVKVEYLLKNGKTASRTYAVPYDAEYERLFDQVRFSEEYLTKRAPAFTYQPSGHDEVDVYTYLQANRSYNNNEVAAKNMNQDEVEAILAALRADIMRFTPEKARTEAPVLRLVFTSTQTEAQMIAMRNGEPVEEEYDEGYVVQRSSDDIAVYPSYRETLAKIEQYTGVTPIRPSTEYIVSAEIKLYNHEGDETYSKEMKRLDKETGEETAVVTDQKDLEALLQNAIVSVELDMADRSYEAEPYVLGEKGFQIIAQLKNGQITPLYYPAGKAPDQVFAKYFPQY